MKKTMRLSCYVLLAMLAMVGFQANAISVIGDPNVQINGNLGIGTASPSGPLHILRNDASTTAQSFRVEQSGAGNTQMSFVITGNYTYSMGIDNGDGDKFKITRGNFGALNDFVINHSGYLGIGTNNPQKVLHILSNTSGNHDLWVQNTGTGTAGLFLTANGGLASYKVYSYGTSFGIWDINAGANRFTMTNTGNIGIGTNAPATKLDVAGEATVDVLNIDGGADLSEKFDVRNLHGDSVEPGMVLSIDPSNPGELLVSSGAYDRTVAGIVSGAGGLNTGMLMGQAGSDADGKFPVALTGRVYCLADAVHGAIQPGDLLTTSETPGHAMKVVDHETAQGAIIGKAMTGLEDGTGLVLVLVTLQ